MFDKIKADFISIILYDEKMCVCAQSGICDDTRYKHSA